MRDRAIAGMSAIVSPTMNATAPTDPPTKSAAKSLVAMLIKRAIEGVGPFTGAEELAAKYLADPRYTTTEQRVRALIASHSLWNLGTGFATGLGGLITLPVAIPTALTASWVIQTRLAGAVAGVHGHPLDDDRVMTFVLLTLIGSSGTKLLKEAGITVGNRLALKGVEAIPARLLVEINKRVGMRLLATAGERGVVNLARVVPLVGGVVAGSIDYAYCRAVGHRADAVFRAPVAA